MLGGVGLLVVHAVDGGRQEIVGVLNRHQLAQCVATPTQGDIASVLRPFHTDFLELGIILLDDKVGSCLDTLVALREVHPLFDPNIPEVVEPPLAHSGHTDLLCHDSTVQEVFEHRLFGGEQAIVKENEGTGFLCCVRDPLPLVLRVSGPGVRHGLPEVFHQLLEVAVIGFLLQCPIGADCILNANKPTNKKHAS